MTSALIALCIWTSIKIAFVSYWAFITRRNRAYDRETECWLALHGDPVETGRAAVDNRPAPAAAPSFGGRRG